MHYNAVLKSFSIKKIDIHKLRAAPILPETTSTKKAEIQPIFFVLCFFSCKSTFTCFLDLSYSATYHFVINGFTVRAVTTLEERSTDWEQV